MMCVVQRSTSMSMSAAAAQHLHHMTTTLPPDIIAACRLDVVARIRPLQHRFVVPVKVAGALGGQVEVGSQLRGTAAHDAALRLDGAHRRLRAGGRGDSR